MSFKRNGFHTTLRSNRDVAVIIIIIVIIYYRYVKRQHRRT